MIYEVLLNFSAVTFNGDPRTIHSPGREGALRITKPLVVASGGRLLYNAYSWWDNDEGLYGGVQSSIVPGQTWDNRFDIYATNGETWELIWSAEAEGMTAELYETAAQAYTALAALLPLEFTGWDRYKIQSTSDHNTPDNRGGLSLIIEMRSEQDGRELVLNTPNMPIVESWQWITDVATAYDGLENRIPLLRYPRRTFSGSFNFDNIRNVQNHVAFMLKNFDHQFRLPLFQYQSITKQAHVAGTYEVFVNARRGNIKPDVECLIIEGDKWEIIVPRVVEAGKLTIQTPLRYSFGRRAMVVPITKVYSNTNASITRKNPDHSASSSFQFEERLPTLPFVPPLNEAVVATFDGLPVLPFVPQGTGFDATLATGLTVIDYVGRADLISPWNVGKWGYNLSFKASHIGASQDFAWWQKFAEVIQGSANPFLMATNRADFDVVTPAVGGGATVTVQGDSYSEYYWEHGAFQRIFIDSDAGRHYAKITGLAVVDGNDRLTFAPALPAGAAWSSNQKVGFMLKLRNDNDRIICNHYGLNTEVSMAARTVE